MMARALAGNNPVFHEVVNDLDHRPGNTTGNMNSLLLEELHGFQSHAPCKDMGNAAGCEQARQFSRFVAGIQYDLVM